MNDLNKKVDAGFPEPDELLYPYNGLRVTESEIAMHKVRKLEERVNKLEQMILKDE